MSFSLTRIIAVFALISFIAIISIQHSFADDVNYPEQTPSEKDVAPGTIPKCKANEEVVTCFYSPESTCQDPNPENQGYVCFRGFACKCKKGYLRLGESCVEKDSCPSNCEN